MPVAAWGSVASVIIDSLAFGTCMLRSLTRLITCVELVALM